MNKNSIVTYFDPENQKKYQSHRARIMRELFQNPNQHSYQLSKRLGLSNEAIKKRLNDLINDDEIEISGNREYYNRTVSEYKIKDQLSMFPTEKKITLRQWLKKEHPKILHEFNQLY